jgi:hypothetical protein
MPRVTINLESTEAVVYRKLELETEFLPRVGDILNLYDHLDYPEEHGWFWIIYDIEWTSVGGALEPKLKLVPHQKYERADILRRHGWIISNAQNT